MGFPIAGAIAGAGMLKGLLDSGKESGRSRKLMGEALSEARRLRDFAYSDWQRRAPLRDAFEYGTLNAGYDPFNPWAQVQRAMSLPPGGIQWTPETGSTPGAGAGPAPAGAPGPKGAWSGNALQGMRFTPEAGGPPIEAGRFNEWAAAQPPADAAPPPAPITIGGGGGPSMPGLGGFGGPGGAPADPSLIDPRTSLAYRRVSMPPPDPQTEALYRLLMGSVGVPGGGY